MGRITSESPKETTTTHFSHPHPLKLCSYIPLQTPNLSSSCSGCKFQPSGLIYSCNVCSFFLHKKCFEMPMKITHPCHKDHAFTLLTQPAYADGMFKCDACGKNGDGFSYHCKPCGNDLHILCSAMPLSITHSSHVHKLELTFGSPYPTKDFCCDICKKVGSDHWIYRCNLCAFDAHLHCAKSVSPMNNMGFQPHQGSVPQVGATFTRSAPQPPQGYGPHYMAATPSFMQHNFVPPSPAAGIPAGFPVLQHNPYTVDRERNQLFLQYLQQIIQNNNAMTQAILAGGTTGLGAGGVAGLGGGFGGGMGGIGAGGLGGAGGGFGAGGFGADNGYQQLMQLYSSMNGGFGGGGGGQELLQALMNGGFGGGGGGLDLLQSLSGGGGGLDFLGGMLGGFGL
ncbi:uncharacterized protein [Primulina eburnea]|uniref:uncharacterized protein n=1 Tax=Primulina eburnea TaxID=1245227 RepID=UPI003C6C5F2B